MGSVFLKNPLILLLPDTPNPSPSSEFKEREREKAKFNVAGSFAEVGETLSSEFKDPQEIIIRTEFMGCPRLLSLCPVLPTSFLPFFSPLLVFPKSSLPSSNTPSLGDCSAPPPPFWSTDSNFPRLSWLEAPPVRPRHCRTQLHFAAARLPSQPRPKMHSA